MSRANVMLPLAIALGVEALVAVAGDAPGQTGVEWRGRVVCVDVSEAIRPCQATANRFALQTSDGKLHLFAAADSMTAMFEDGAVRERELLVRARRMPSGDLETIKVYSLREGHLHDLDYFCEVCNVVAYARGLCVCCRQPLTLRERPLPTAHGGADDER